MPVGNSKGKADFFTDPDSDTDDRGSESAIYAICRSLSRARQRVIPESPRLRLGLVREQAPNVSEGNPDFTRITAHPPVRENSL